jgi:hypothetical protein
MFPEWGITMHSGPAVIGILMRLPTKPDVSHMAQGSDL